MTLERKTMDKQIEREIIKLLNKMFKLALDNHKHLKDNEQMIFKAKPKSGGVFIYPIIVSKKVICLPPPSNTVASQ